MIMSDVIMCQLQGYRPNTKGVRLDRKKFLEEDSL